MDKADEFYMEARNAVIEAVSALDRRHKRLRTPDGVTLRIQRRPPLRIYKLMIYRAAPGEQGWTSFNFQRGGRVDLGGNRKIPLQQAIAMRHDSWASRAELAELEAQIRSAVPA